MSSLISTYCGWTNKETWYINRLVENDKGFNNRILEQKNLTVRWIEKYFRKLVDADEYCHSVKEWLVEDYISNVNFEEIYEYWKNKQKENDHH